MSHLPFNRRSFIASSGLGIGLLAQQVLLASEAQPALTTGTTHHPATAKRVIFLFMSGGPSQVDTFDPKPELDRLAGQDVPESIAANVPSIQRAGLKNLMASPWKFHHHGQSGMSISTLFTETAKHADDLCVIRSMTHRNPVHGPGECVALTGTATGERPSLGAWSIYGLGRATDELPASFNMNLHTDGMQFPQAAGWGPGFLPVELQGTVVDPVQGIRHVTMPDGVSTEQRLRELETIRALNERYLDRVRPHSELDARVRSYEMAFRMQTAAPELFDLDGETRETHELYGLGDEASDTVARGCLLARRLVERGVRFVQVRVGGWDAHGNIKGNHERMVARTDQPIADQPIADQPIAAQPIADQPIAALLEDFKRRGLLDSTLIVWGGEFGRTPTMEGRGEGRDHSPTAYTVWLAGGGSRGGQIIGETDPLGYTVTQRPVSPQDLHATILHSLGLNAHQLTYQPPRPPGNPPRGDW